MVLKAAAIRRLLKLGSRVTHAVTLDWGDYADCGAGCRWIKQSVATIEVIAATWINIPRWLYSRLAVRCVTKPE